MRCLDSLCELSVEKCLVDIEKDDPWMTALGCSRFLSTPRSGGFAAEQADHAWGEHVGGHPPLNISTLGTRRFQSPARHSMSPEKPQRHRPMSLSARALCAEVANHSPRYLSVCPSKQRKEGGMLSGLILLFSTRSPRDMHSRMRWCGEQKGTSLDPSCFV